MKKSLVIYQEQVRILKRQRDALDEDVAQVLAEALHDGYNILDLLDLHFSEAPEKARPKRIRTDPMEYDL